MLDRIVRPIIDPMLEALSAPIAAKGISANQVTNWGFGFGLAAIAAIALGAYWLGFALLLLNRLADGIDGCLARQQTPTDLGGYLDIVLDLIVYSGLVLGLAIAMPQYALVACFLLFSFVGTGASFLAFAIFATKRNLVPTMGPKKGFYYLGGITEGTETILFFCLVILFPNIFAEAAIVFGILCLLTTVGRIATAVQFLRQ